MMLCLGIDTVSAKPSVALVDGDNKTTLARQDLPVGRGQSAALLTAVEGLLKESGRRYQDLNKLMVMTGPGSFTGIRVGISFLKGVALSLGVPLYGANHFEVIQQAQNTDTEDNYLIALEAGRDEKFFHFVKGGQLTGAPLNMDLDHLAQNYAAELAQCQFVISDFTAENSPTPLTWHVLSENTAEQLICALLNHSEEPAKAPAPYYIRPADTTL